MAATHDYETEKVRAGDLDNTMVLVGESGGLSAVYGNEGKVAFGLLGIETEHGMLMLDPDEEIDVLEVHA